MFTVRHYITEDEHGPFQKQLKKLHDLIAKGQVVRCVGRIKAGNSGDHEPCREGVWELRIDQGPGYRAYCAMTGAVMVLLPCGGDKGTQDASVGRVIGF